jgi:hypothetical protein
MAKGIKIETRTYTEAEYQDGKPYRDAQQIRETFKNDNQNYNVGKITYKTIDNNPSSIDNPIKNAPYGSAFMLNSNNPVYYLRFGYLLEYIKENIIPRVKVSKESNHASNPPMFDIDTNSWDNYMYSLPNQISLDPTKCIVRNNNFNSGRGITKVFQKIQYFREADIDPKSNQYSALPLNIYLNFDFITECLKVDDRGDVNLYEFISSICTGLNKALGGINNLEPIIDETSNTLKIIDTTPIPGRSGEKPEENYLLQLHGYKKSRDGATSNFIRKLELKTAITPEYATMITVGATAGGYVKGTEATAFSKWNTGLVDRFKEDFTPGKETSVKKPDEEDEAEVNYVTEFLYNGYVSRYGFSSFSSGNFKLVDDLIQKNISVGTEYYKYLLSKNKLSSGGTIGFIPFKLNFTMDGLSGIKIYNKLEVNTEFLPKAYGNNMDLIVTGVNHRLSNNDWETDIEATIIPKSSNLENITISTKSIQNSVNKVKKKGKDLSKNPNKVCGLASANNVNTVYPRSVKWQLGTSPVIVNASNPPGVSINLKNQPTVKYSKTIVTAKEYIKVAETIIDKLAPSASTLNKKKILISAFAISRAEQGYEKTSFRGFNNNISGIESSGFSVYKKSDVVGKVSLPEGDTEIPKYYYAFSSISAGLVPLISKIMERNMFATGGQPNEFAWRYFRDWNGYGARGTTRYSTDPNYDDCDIINNFESSYRTALTQVNSYSKYK